jgi:glycosyltransferase involved in cell wall biosynthesis
MLNRSASDRNSARAEGTTRSKEPVRDHPTLSVIVPVYNAAEHLKLCLSALADSHYDDFEVLVVDDGSTEPVEPLVTRSGYRCIRVDGPKGPARARNRGVARVRGRYVVFVDADVCVHSDALARFAESFASDTDTVAVVGSYDDAPAEPGFFSQYKNLFHHYVHQSCHGRISTFWSGCGAVRRDLFVAFGGFDERRYHRPSIEDIELGTRITAANHRIVLDNRIAAKHLKRWTLWGLLRTDVFDRGVPWTRLMWRAGAVADTLNVKPAQRVSVVLASLTALFGAAAARWPLAFAGAAALALTVTILNRDLYRFFARRKGLWFAIRVIPMHWLYLGYCGFSAVYGTLLYWLIDRSERPASTVPRYGRG